MTRAALETLLLKHTNWDGKRHYFSDDGFSELLDALTAAQGAPSREALETIMREAAGGFSFCRELTDRIMAWATRHPVPKWCSHMVHEVDGYKFLQGSYTMQTWNWDQCPIEGCHAPRPEAA